MLMTIGIFVLLAILVILGLASTKGDTFVVSRSASVNAPAPKVFALINDFHQWQGWSPWEKMDPGMKKTASGAASGKGAIYEWEGNDKVGKGRMEIQDSVPSSKITIKLDFYKPFEAHNTAEFTLEPKGDSTVVNWAMSGPNPVMMRIIQVFVSMDKMVGKDFERGLANLKGIAEK